MISVSELQVGLFEYVRNEMIPHLEGISIPLVGGLNIPISKELMQIGFGTLAGVADLKIEKATPILQFFGIISDSGMIDVDKIAPVLKEQVSKVGSFKLPLQLGNNELIYFTFNNNDIDTFVSYLQ